MTAAAFVQSYLSGMNTCMLANNSALLAHLLYQHKGLMEMNEGAAFFFCTANVDLHKALEFESFRTQS